MLCLRHEQAESEEGVMWLLGRQERAVYGEMMLELLGKRDEEAQVGAGCFLIGAAWIRRLDALLSKEALISKNGSVNFAEVLKTRLVGFYVGAHCYPPTRLFTPLLIDYYNVVNAQGKIFEVIYVSDDREAENMQEYFNSMP